MAKKSDVIVVSMDSPYPAEAAAVANGVVNAYLAEQSRQKQATGGEMLKSLEAEKAQLKSKRDAVLAAMVKTKQDGGVLSFRDDKGNIILDRTTSLSAALAAAEVTTMELRGQEAATKAALADPKRVPAFVESQQFKGHEFGDHEFDELRSQLAQSVLAMLSANTTEGPGHPGVQGIRTVVESLRQRVADKERSIADAQLISVSAQLSAAEEKERQLRDALRLQRDRALGLVPAAAEYERLDAEAAQLQKQSELLDARIAQVSVDHSVDAASPKPLNVRVLEWARAEERPVNPNKTLTLAAALMAGCVLGTGLALVRERRDGRLYEPGEIPLLLGTPVVAAVPRINARLSSVARGQLVHLDSHSPAAEAYRSARTALQLGAGATRGRSSWPPRRPATASRPPPATWPPPSRRPGTARC